MCTADLLIIHSLYTTATTTPTFSFTKNWLQAITGTKALSNGFIYKSCGTNRFKLSKSCIKIWTTASPCTIKLPISWTSPIAWQNDRLKSSNFLCSLGDNTLRAGMFSWVRKAMFSSLNISTNFGSVDKFLKNHIHFSARRRMRCALGSLGKFLNLGFGFAWLYTQSYNASTSPINPLGNNFQCVCLYDSWKKYITSH